MEVNLLIFKDEKTKDAVTYHSWWWDVAIFHHSGWDDQHLLPHTSSGHYKGSQETLLGSLGEDALL